MTLFHRMLTHGSLAFGAACLAAPSSPAADVTLILEGQPKSAILAPADLGATNRVLLAAAVADLAACLEQMSGAAVPVLTNAPIEAASAIPILVGAPADKVFGGPARKTPYQQGWRLTVTPKAVGLMGESDEAISYAIYELLHRLGCRWFMPGPWGSVIPERKTISLPELDVSGEPFTAYRGIWYADKDFKRRNRLGGRVLHASHALETYISKEQLQAHPDWAAEIGGARKPESGRLCWANPDVAAAVADAIIAKLDQTGARSVSLSPNDGVSFCQCTACKALDTGDFDPSMGCVSLTDRLLHFCNAIVERVTAKYPDTLFGMLAYVQYTRPPLREKPHRNLVPQIAPITYCRAHAMTDPACPSRPALRPIVEGWANVSTMISMYQYAYNLAEVSVPYPMLTQWSDELPIIFANKCRFWMPETMPNFASAGPGLYLGLRLAWDPAQKPAAILDEYFQLFYGAAAEPMREHWETLDQAWVRTPAHAGSGFDHLRRFTPEILMTAREALDRAAGACRTEAERARVRLADESFRAFELFMKLRRNLAEGRLADLGTDSETWIRNWDRLMTDYKSQYAFSPYGATYFRAFFLHVYRDAARLAREFEVLPVLNTWRYALDPEQKARAAGWTKPDFDDAAWKTTDPAVDTWSSLGLAYDYDGAVCYRTSTRLPDLAAGQKVFL